MNLPCEVVSFIYIRDIKALIKSRDLVSSFVGFLLTDGHVKKANL